MSALMPSLQLNQDQRCSFDAACSVHIGAEWSELFLVESHSYNKEQGQHRIQNS